ncbi:MAG: hypothetical protein WBL31_13145 [Ilumatobacteraceae bacterium]|jgi:hypothetical protein
MKVKAVGVLMLLALVAGYLVGTESGREQRDRLLVKLGRQQQATDEALDLAEAVIEEALDA